ncbi:MAG: F0F1 ATP synthase subunit A [Elusimicrobia bacterium]|nr:F0F1 ATP synthase subunit A [Elusimicrobiota bacterium]
MQLAPQTVFTLFGFPITNTVITTLIVNIVIVTIIFIVTRFGGLVPGKVQNAVEMAVEYFYSATESIAGKRAEFIYPWVATIFIFIVLSNIMGLLPGFESIYIISGGEHIPLLRSATSDLNTTLALAAVSLAAVHFYAIKYTGAGYYVNRFVPYKSLKFTLSAVLMFFVFLFVGAIEAVSELVKVVSLSFRLFGNVYSGELVINTIATTFLNIAPINALGISISLRPLAYFAPFFMMLLEFFIAIIQALVFAMLTMSFMATLTSRET